MKKLPTEDIQFLGLPTMMNSRDFFSFNFILQDSGPCIAYFPHYHDYYEISFYYGKKPAVYRVGDEEYSANYGDIILCDMFEPHMFMVRDNEEHEHLTLGVNASMLVSLSNDEQNLVQIFDKNKRSHPILHINTVQFSKYLDVIKNLYKNDTKYSTNLYERALAIQMLSYLFEDTYEERAVNNVNLKNIELVSRVKQYVDTHIDCSIALSELAAATNYSTNHLCRVFKSATGKTLIQYINAKRIQNAKTLLSGPLSVTEIAFKTGFDSYSYFYRVFKKYAGVGPEEYRRING